MRVITHTAPKAHVLYIVQKALTNNTRNLHTSWFNHAGQPVKVEFKPEGGNDCWLAIVTGGRQNEIAIGTVFFNGADLT